MTNRVTKFARGSRQIRPDAVVIHDIPRRIRLSMTNRVTKFARGSRQTRPDAVVMHDIPRRIRLPTLGMTRVWRATRRLGGTVFIRDRFAVFETRKLFFDPKLLNRLEKS
jgi:hypothetical protein